MTPFRIIFVLGSLLTISGASYMSYNGIWSESTDLDRSVRTGSRGGYYLNTRVK